MFWVVVTVGYFHLLHVGGPLHPNLKWEGCRSFNQVLVLFLFFYIATIYVQHHCDF